MVKVVGFIGSLAAGAALVGTAVTGTGAYFTDSDPGNLKADAGNLTLNTANTTLSFTAMNPGEDQFRDIPYNVNATGKSDVWLTFDNTKAAYAAFTGPKGGLVDEGGMGRFGHFAVANDGVGLFESWNLQILPVGSTDPVCYVDSDGHGSGIKPADRAATPPLCGVPTAIKIASNLSSTQGGTMRVTFGLTGRASNGYKNLLLADVPFQVVATQAGHRPDASDF